MVCDEEALPALRERARRLPSVTLSLRSQYDLDMLAVGAFSPLDRFMGPGDYESVLGQMRLGDGTISLYPSRCPCRRAPCGVPRAKLHWSTSAARSWPCSR